MSIGKIGAAVLTASVVLASASAYAAPAGRPHTVNARERHQTARIREGIQSGEITRAEANRIRANEAAVRAEERVYRQSGDGLNRRERVDLQRDLNRTSRQIYRDKHNNRDRPAAPAPAQQ